MIFDDTVLYRQTHADAHKEHPTNIAPPALTWHMAFVIPKRKIANGGNAVSHDVDTRYSLDEVKSRLDAVVLQLIRTIAEAGLLREVLPSIKGTAILFTQRIDLQTLETVVNVPWSDRQKSVLEGDERALVVEFVWDDWVMTVRIHLRTNLFTVTVIAQDKTGGGIAVNNTQDFKRYTVDFWGRFTEFLFGLDGIHLLFRSDILSGVYADIQGVVMPCSSFACSIEQIATTQAIPDWAGPVIEKLAPIVTDNNEYDCIASYMLKRRALHLTALGPQPLNFPDNKRMPITFLLCVQTHDAAGRCLVGKRQIGRLLDRMHLIGTLRLAALLDLALLRDASAGLSQIDRFYKAARDKIASYDKSQFEAGETRDALDLARQKLNEISNDFLKSSGAGVGLSFRIESARYYTSQFHKNLSALRLGRVEGYQRYDHFVERRLGTIFEFIDRLGIRYERAISQLAAIDQGFASVQARHTDSAVKDIQASGELVLLCVLVPYYMIGIYKDVTEVPVGVARSLLALSIFGVVVFASFRYIDGKDDVTDIIKIERRHQILVLAVLLLAVLIIAPRLNG
jgi:hypothetical protein